MALSWATLCHLHRLLQQPLAQQDASAQLAALAGMLPRNADRALDSALALRLLWRDEAGGLHRPPAETPEAWARTSALVRLMSAWRALHPQPPDLAAAKTAFQAIGEGRVTILQDALRLSRRAGATMPPLLTPRSWLLEEMVLCWRERHDPTADLAWDAMDAWAAYRALLPADTKSPEEAFVQACLLLYQRRRAQITAIQFLLGVNRRYETLRSPVGYLRSIYPLEQDRGDAQPLPQDARRGAQGRRLVG